ncbi:MAG: branched-chain amino acid ABC transporter permease, partial [Aestuariivirgaceae bacterium]
MLYRETGQFKTNYSADQAVFPIRQDLIGIWVLLAFMFAVVPFTFNDFWLNSIMIPTLVFGLAAIGLNLLTGYAGQLSLGTGGFMGCG